MVLRVCQNPFPGVIDPMLRDMANCGKGRDDSHACKNLHRLLHNSGHTIPVKISTVTTPVRLRKRGSSKKALVQFPLLKLSDWCQCIFKRGGQFLLAGQTLDAAYEFGQTLEEFWRRFKGIEPQHTFFSSIEEREWRFCIPYALHGDEGRGAGKRPIMILSAQPFITTPDMSSANQSGCLALLYSFCCRLYIYI